MMTPAMCPIQSAPPDHQILASHLRSVKGSSAGPSPPGVGTGLQHDPSRRRLHSSSNVPRGATGLVPEEALPNWPFVRKVSLSAPAQSIPRRINREGCWVQGGRPLPRAGLPGFLAYVLTAELAQGRPEAGPRAPAARNHRTSAMQPRGGASGKQRAFWET